jgi:lycopene cyclase CruP
MRTVGPLTSRAFSSLPSSVPTAGGAGGSSQIDALIQQDAALQRLFNQEWPPAEPPRFVDDTMQSTPLGTSANYDVDVVVCGGTLGILLACSLQLQGHRVAVIEAGPLRGRDQDWNTSMDELLQLVDAGVLDASEIELVAPLAFGPMRCHFGPPTPDRFELQLQGVLDIGVSPTKLLRCVRERFEANGGLVLERTAVRGVAIHTNGAALRFKTSSGADDDAVLHSRLVVDCMGHRSPIALQQRAGQRPSGVCVQVGSCARGEWARQWRSSGDFFVTADDAKRIGPDSRARAQLFWQAFPASGGGGGERSTYMFTYLKPGVEMPGLLEVMEEYWRALPAYQNIRPRERAGGAGDAEAPLAQVEPKRILFGWFPTYKGNSPLAPRFDRVLSVGDASAVQSPISFGGFCAMLRHLPRYTRGLDLALRSDRLGRHDLARLTPYMPNLGTAWMSASAMTASASCSRGDAIDADAPSELPYTLVNELLEGNFKVMESLPRQEAIVFFRDVTTFSTLAAVLLGQTATMAPLLPRVVAELVGPLELAEFGGHLLMLSLYTALYRLVTATGLDRTPPAADDYVLSCALDALAYGSGLDASSRRASNHGSPLPPPPPSPPPLPPPPPLSKGAAREGASVDAPAAAAAPGPPWWRRPPPTWPPRLDDPSLILGDVVACYSTGFVALTVLTSGRAAEWPAEGATIACAWMVGAAVTNAWDPTAVLPSLGAANAVKCVARMAIDAASTRALLALVGAAVSQQRVDVPLLVLELALSTSAMMLWRVLYMATNPDPR